MKRRDRLLWFFIRFRGPKALLDKIKGRPFGVGFDGGSTHPNGLQRFLWQRQEFLILLESNYGNVLSKSQFEELEAEYTSRMEVLNKIGLVSAGDGRALLDPMQCDTYEVAANLLETLDIEELTGLIPHLRKMRETLSS